MSTQSDLAELYTTFFNRAPDADGLAYWVDSIDSGQLSLTQIAENWLTEQPEGQTNFPTTLTDAQFVAKIYTNVLSRTADADGAQYWLDQLASGAVTRDSFALSIINGAKANTSAQGVLDATLISNKATVGVAFAEQGVNDTALAAKVLTTVTADASTLNSTLAVIALIPSSAAAQTPAILAATDQLLTNFANLITAAPGELADATTYLQTLAAGITSGTNITTLLSNANTLITSAATNSAALDNPAVKGAADVVVATPGTGGGTPATTFTATDVDGTLTFGGDATGDITLVSFTNNVAVFARGGVSSESVSLLDVTIIQASAPLSLKAAQLATLSPILESTNSVKIVDTGAEINAALAALVPNAPLIDSIDASDATPILLTQAQLTAITSAKLTAGDIITVSDNSLTGAQIATLGDDPKVDFIRAATQTLTSAQYAAASAKLSADDTITVDEDILTAAQIVSLSGQANVDTVVTLTALLNKTQYAAAKAKLDAGTVTVSDDTLTGAEIALLGADTQVDLIRASTQTLTNAQYAAAALKLDAGDTITVDQDTLTAAQIATLGADAKVDAIVTLAAVLDKTQYAAASAKLDATTITVDDDSLTGAEIAVLGGDSAVTSILAATQTLTNAQFTAASAKLSAGDSITVDDNGLTGVQIGALGADAKVDFILADTQSLTASQFGAAAVKLSTADTITVADTGANIATQLTSLVANAAKVDIINSTNDLLTLTAVQGATLAAKLTAADVITFTNTLGQGSQTIAFGAFQSANDKLAFTGAELTGITGFTDFTGLAGDTITFAGGTIGVVSGSGAVAAGAEATFIFDTDTKILSFDADGTGSVAAAVPLLVLTGVATVVAADFIVA